MEARNISQTTSYIIAPERTPKYEKLPSFLSKKSVPDKFVLKSCKSDKLPSLSQPQTKKKKKQSSREKTNKPFSLFESLIAQPPNDARQALTGTCPHLEALLLDLLQEGRCLGALLGVRGKVVNVLLVGLHTVNIPARARGVSYQEFSGL